MIEVVSPPRQPFFFFDIRTGKNVKEKKWLSGRRDYDRGVFALETTWPDVCLFSVVTQTLLLSGIARGIMGKTGRGVGDGGIKPGDGNWEIT